MNFKAIFAVLFGCLLSACQGINPVMDTARLLFPPGDISAHYQPGTEYLLVDHAGHKAAMALGWRKAEGAVVQEYWYSGQREMLHLLNGRLYNVMGMTHELRAPMPAVQTVRATPSWQAIAEAAQSRTHDGALVWSRTRDVQPGYRYGVVEYITSKQVPPTRAQQALIGRPADWYEDQVDSKTQDGQAWRYTDVFAVANGRVVYSLQCVGPNLCLHLQAQNQTQGAPKP